MFIKFQPIKRERGLTVSRLRIGRIMQEQGLVSAYTVAQFKPHVKSCNESEQKNELNRKFDQEEEMSAIVSDLTYVKVNQNWHYVCVFVDLFNREIAGCSTGPNKDALHEHKATTVHCETSTNRSNRSFITFYF